MKKYLFIFIIIVASFLRFYQLGTLAPALTWDEVAWGYNAYTLGIDARDEFGRFLPYDYLESFGDFKPPMYAYLDILPVKLFGLTEFAVRFPSAFFGILTVIVSYFLTRRIFSGSKYNKSYALITSLLLAISPWHILLSRAAFEANVATFFLVTGVWLFLEGVYKKPWLLILSAIAFVASIYTFNSTRIVAPILVLTLVIFFWKKLWSTKKQAIVAAIVGIALLFPTVPFLLSPQASLRFKEVNIFSDITIIERTNQEVVNDQNEWWSKLIHNRRLAYGVEYVKHYFDTFSPNFLFITGDENPKFSIQSQGQLYLWELPFLVMGILFLFRKREQRWWVIPVWMLIGIIPAATARETPHALRLETTLPMFQILVAYGLVGAFIAIKTHIGNFPLKKVLTVVIILVSAFSLFQFAESYFVHYSKKYSDKWQYGYKDAILYANTNKTQFQKIYLTEDLGRAYIYTLFYTKYDPRSFRNDASIYRDTFGFVHVQRVGKYYFDKTLLKSTDKQGTLFIDSPVNVMPGAKVQKKFYLLNGEEILRGYTL